MLSSTDLNSVCAYENTKGMKVQRPLAMHVAQSDCVLFLVFFDFTINKYQDSWNKNHFQLISTFVQLLFAPLRLSATHEIKADENSFPTANSVVSSGSTAM